KPAHLQGKKSRCRDGRSLETARCPMETLSPANHAEHLFARGRTRALIRANGRELLVELLAAVGFVLAALAMAVFLDSPRDLEAAPLVALVVAYVIACQAQFDIADGYTVPTELVLVP